MKEAMAVTGYVPDDVAKQLTGGKHGGPVKVFAQPGREEVFAQIDPSQIAEVRDGASSQGTTLVQLILKENAPVETIISSRANRDGLSRLHDPVLGSLIERIKSKSIYV